MSPLRLAQKSLEASFYLRGRRYLVFRKAWEPYTGPKGGKGWKRGKEIRYQTEKPSEAEGEEVTEKTTSLVPTVEFHTIPQHGEVRVEYGDIQDESGEDVGFYRWNYIADTKTAVFELIEVSDFRQGHGSRVLAQIEAKARQLGATRLEGDSTKDGTVVWPLLGFDWTPESRTRALAFLSRGGVDIPGGEDLTAREIVTTPGAIDLLLEGGHGEGRGGDILLDMFERNLELSNRLHLDIVKDLTSKESVPKTRLTRTETGFRVDTEATEAPPRELISKDTLQYVVEREGDWVIKTPKPGFGFQPSADDTYAQRLEGIVPETQLVQERGVSVLKQRFVDGREATEDETEEMRKRIREKGVSPRGLLPQDIIVDGDGRKWVIDVGNFEKLRKDDTLTSTTPGSYTPRTRSKRKKRKKDRVLEKQGRWRDREGHSFPTPQGLAGHIAQTGHTPVEEAAGERRPAPGEEEAVPTGEGDYSTPQAALNAILGMGGGRITRTETGFQVQRSKPRPAAGSPAEVYGEYVEQFRPVFKKTLADLKSEFGEKNTRGRLKSPQSLKEKVEVRQPGRRASDIIGLMVLADDYGGMEETRARIREKYTVVEEDDRFLFDPGAGYYRAVHFLVETEGTVAEVQVMTHDMYQLKEWGHKFIYKGTHGGEERLIAYATELGEWVNTKNRGEDPGEKPECPPDLLEEGLCLPF